MRGLALPAELLCFELLCLQCSQSVLTECKANAGLVAGVQRDFEVIHSFIKQLGTGLFGESSALGRELNSFLMRGYEDASMFVELVLVGAHDVILLQPTYV